MQTFWFKYATYYINQYVDNAYENIYTFRFQYIQYSIYSGHIFNINKNIGVI